MLDGFWILQTKVPEGTGGGVATLIGGKIFGGDNGFCFMGTYYADGANMKARVMVQNFDPLVPSVFGLTGDYELEVSAVVRVIQSREQPCWQASQRRVLGFDSLRGRASDCVVRARGHPAS